VSFRDLQFWPGWPQKPNALGQNWVLGKGLDSSFPLGPWLVTPDEVSDFKSLRLTLKVNGKVMQQASTSDMVFGVDDLVAYLSRGMTLYPGDVISTGTPPGVAVFTGAPYLKDGDIVEASVSRIGTITNPVRAVRPNKKSY
jgi:2-keto-4-pentenoate hydratase/2-oxohepta-3-ene-1,7-dioic acid hydratase in catechol pathway